jgi:hypothetical protein
VLAAHRQFLVAEQCIGAALFNLALNAAIAWGMYRHLEVVPLWGQESIAGDTIGTCFFLPFFTALIVTRLAAGRVRDGKLPAVERSRESYPGLGRLPTGTLGRAVALGLSCAVVFGPAALLTLWALEVGSLPFWPFVSFKAAFAAVLAALVTPAIALAAIADASRARPVATAVRA